MNDAVNDCGDVQEFLGLLQGAVSAMDTDDLSGLAKMHGWCQQLAECADGAMKEQCQALLTVFEGLILGETSDSQGDLAKVREGIQKLGGSSPAEVAKPVGELTDEEAAAKLADLLGEDSTEAGGSAQRSPTPSAGDLPSSQPTATAPAVPDEYVPEPLRIDPAETEFVKAFAEEAAEHIEAVEAALLEVERVPDNAEKIDDLFRPFHTIKGMAGFLNLRDVSSLTHEAETLLDQARKGKRSITPGLIDLVFDVVDILKVQTGEIAGWLAAPTADAVPQPAVVDMISMLRDVVAGRIEPGVRETGEGAAAQKLGENLVEQGVCPKEVVDFALEKQQKASNEGKRTGDVLMELGAVTPKQISKALRPQAKSAGSGAAGGQIIAEVSVRIDTSKLDALVDLVGEMVIAQTQVESNPQVTGDPKLSKDASQVSKIVRDVQEMAMSLRMIPVGGTFQKMARLVRDVSRKAGKKVELVITGEDTELDKNVIQQINDPLVHMIRNACDHGIETPEVRQAAGKPPAGKVHLSAYHQGGNIVIEIADDGAGLSPEKLITKAIEKGIINPDEEMTDQQAYQLIFAPGFSMAAAVTDISGRGVGMDVVRRNIEQLRGRVEIESELGKGSTFKICLPLTLAIIDGMAVGVGSERLIIQTITIEQSLRPRSEQITTVQNKGELLNVRGDWIPLIQLGQLFGFSGRIDPCEAMVVVTNANGERFGLVVEKLLGQQQVVIKTLGERFEKLCGISGAAILGDGRVGLILEMTGLATANEAYKSPMIHTKSDDPAPEIGNVETDEAHAPALV